MLTTQSLRFRQNIPVKLRSLSLNRLQNAYYQAFLLAVILCWLPVKVIALVAPYIVLFWYILHSRSFVVVRNTIFWLVAWIIIILFHAVVDPQFVIANGVVAIITFGAFIIIVAIPTRFVMNKLLFVRMQDIVIKGIVLEGMFGILQASYGFLQVGTFDRNNGDVVAGTISMSLLPDGTLSNPMYAINIGFMLLMILPVSNAQQRHWMIFVVGGIVLVLASVMHVLIFLAVAYGGAVLVYRPRIHGRLRRFSVILMMIVILPTMSFTLLAQNWSTLPTYLSGFFQGYSPRAQALQRVIEAVPTVAPWFPWIGLGPGQFSSNASEISAGLYFAGGQTVPLLPVKMSPYAAEYLVDLWTQYSYGSTYQPRSSWLTIYTELGIFVFIGIFAYVFFFLVRISLFVKTSEQKWLATSYTAAVIFLMLLGFQYNYWEVPQAILIGIMCIKALYGQVFALMPQVITQRMMSDQSH